MPRPPDGRCRNVKRSPVVGRVIRCKNRLPPENSRSDLTRKTDVCDECGRYKLRLYLRSPAGQAWLAQWRAVMKDLEALGREMGGETS